MFVFCELRVIIVELIILIPVFNFIFCKIAGLSIFSGDTNIFVINSESTIDKHSHVF